MAAKIFSALKAVLDFYVNEYTALAAATAEGCHNIAEFYGVGFMCGDASHWEPVLVMECGDRSLDQYHARKDRTADMCRNDMFQVGSGTAYGLNGGHCGKMGRRRGC